MSPAHRARAAVPIPGDLPLQALKDKLRNGAELVVRYESADELRSTARPEWSALNSVHYESLVHQRHMLEDEVRTSAYQRGILANRPDFAGRSVLDVGAGTGILSIFAAQAGARRVFAVEQNSSADHARQLIAHNQLSDRIEVIRSPISDGQDTVGQPGLGHLPPSQLFVG
jgi:2-polyprenyl-3-methyl-5-hydroxy-6-metoxy-1,4-benzoquinol methylase